MDIADYYNFHRGQTCLIVGVGGNLHLTPPAWFNYPSFGVNTIYKYQGCKPTYFVGVDERLEREDGKAISDVYQDVIKFIPYPDRDSWQGENFLRFYHRAGDVIAGGKLPNQPRALTDIGIGYRKIMDAVLQIAWYMGFTTMLMIGVQHKPDDQQAHFWGPDLKSIPEKTVDYWFSGYSEVRRAMGESVRVLNISEDTYVPDEVLPRDDWRKWANKTTVTQAPFYGEVTVTK
jgi:hypothetical protein